MNATDLGFDSYFELMELMLSRSILDIESLRMSLRTFFRQARGRIE